MKGAILRISIILLIIVSLPLGFFLTRELSTLDENEAMVERVFSTQLESILLSLNQYSESLVTHWIKSLDQPVQANGELMKALVENLFENNAGIEAVQFYNLKNDSLIITYPRNQESNLLFEMPGAGETNNLQEYLKAKYQKVETIASGENVQLYFMLKSNKSNTLCQILIDPVVYVEQSLGPQIQQIAQDIFYFEIRDTLSNQTVFSTDEDDQDRFSLQNAPLWYIPHHVSGIQLKAKTVKQLASERSQQSSYILWGMAIVVLLGLGFVILSIRKEMKLAELKSEFVSNVSHEIRTPLALISMYAETLMLKRVKTEEKQGEYLKTIHRESDRLTQIVNRILNFSRIEKNKRTYNFKAVDLNNIVSNVIESCKAHFEVHEVECRYDDAEKSILIKADREAVSDMLMNLFDNAIKYGKEDGKKIDVRIIPKNKYIWLEVKDNGIGISAKNQKYIFDQFYRVTEGNLAQKAKGSGLGLNLVKKMMIAHGGKVAVRSKPGEGSTFILKFPQKLNNHA